MHFFYSFSVSDPYVLVDSRITLYKVTYGLFFAFPFRSTDLILRIKYKPYVNKYTNICSRTDVYVCQQYSSKNIWENKTNVHNTFKKWKTYIKVL